MKALRLCSAIVCLVIAPVTSAFAASKDTIRFVHMASVGGQYSILSSKLVLTKSTNPDIKNLAQQMLDSQTQINDQLMGILPTSSVNVSVVTGSLDDKHQQMLDRLNSMSGYGSDQEYINTELVVIDWMAENFQGYAKGGEDRVLKKFAADNVTTLLQLQQRVKDVILPVSPSNVSELNQDFVRMVEMNGQYEVQAAQLALNKTHNPVVNELAHQLMDDYSRINNQLIAVLPTSTVNGVVISATFDAAHQDSLTQLKMLTSNSFDRQYITTEISVGDALVKRFQDFSQNGYDPVLKDFAANTLPVLIHDQQRLKGIVLPPWGDEGSY